MTAQIDDLADALHAPASYAPLSDQLDLFGRFVGTWDLEWHGKDHNGNDIVARGELHCAPGLWWRKRLAHSLARRLVYVE